jgi:hypothetical protein
LVALPPQQGLGRLIAGFGPGGTESLIFGYILATQFRERICQIIQSTEPRLFLIKFFVPAYVPSPLLTYPSSELEVKLLADQPLPPVSAC